METKQNPNWWKYAFVVTVLLLEIARELLVVAWAEKPQLLVRKSIWEGANLIVAEGRWRRTDGDGALVPNMAAIECDRKKGMCQIVDVTLFDDSVMPPETSLYPADFSANGVTYSYKTNCVVYDVAIDTRAGHATQIRRKLKTNEQTPLSTCDILDDRIEMALTDGWNSDLGDNNFPDGFFPILRLVSWVFS